MNRLFRLALFPSLLWCSLSLGCTGGKGPAGKMALPPPEVLVRTPVEQRVTDYEDFPGRIEAVNAVDIRARVTGHFLEAKFTEGADVKQGDILFEIDPRLYQAQLNRDEANLVQAQARLTRLEGDYQRAMPLLPRGSISKEEFEKIVGDRAEAAAAIGVAKANRELTQQYVRFTKVEAPLSGKISRRYIDPGNLVKADETVLTSIVSLDPVYAYFDLDERTTHWVKRLLREGVIQWSPGQSFPVLLGLPDEQGYPRYGEINFADNRLDSDTGTWRLRARFDNPDQSLSPGMFVRMRVNIGASYPALLIDEKALGTDQDKKFVYVVNDAGKVERRELKKENLGRIHDGMRVILTGVKRDDKVVVSGLQRIREGIEVQAKLAPPPEIPTPPKPAQQKPPQTTAKEQLDAKTDQAKNTKPPGS